MLGHVGRETVENAAHFHDRAGEADFIAKNFGAIGRRENGFADVEADFAPINVEAGHDLDVPGPIRTDLAVHQANGGAVDRGAAVKIDSLDERTGTIADSDDGDTDFSHAKKQILPAALSLRQDTKLLDLEG